MIKGAFGIEVTNGVTQFQDGQKWIHGTAPYFLEQLSRRDTLDGFFPPLVVEGERTPPAWPNSEGVIHVRFLAKAQAWFVVHVYQPQFSMQRSVPLWLCQRIPSSRFQSEMLLAPAVQSAVRARREFIKNDRGGAGWFNVPDPTAESAETLQDLRVAASLFDQLQAGRRTAHAAIESRDFWRGLQVLLCGYAAARGNLWVTITLEPDTAPPQRPDAPAMLSVLVGREGVPVEPKPFACRGVSDERMVKAGKSPSQLITEAWTAARDGHASTCAQLIQPGLELLAWEEVRDEELEPWARALWARESDAHGVIDALIRTGVTRRGDQKIVRRLTAMLLYSPAASRQSRADVLQLITSRKQSALRAG